MLGIVYDAYAKYKIKMFILLLLSIVNSLMSGIGIVIIIPILDFINLDGTNNLVFFSLFVNLFKGISYSERVAIVLLAYVLINIVSAVLYRFISIYEAKFVQTYIKDLRIDLYNNIIGSDWEHFSSEKDDDLLNTFTSEISTISSAMTSYVNLFSITLTAVTQISISFALNVPLSLFVLIAGALIFYVLRKYFVIAKINGEKRRIASKTFLGEIRGQINGIKEIKCYGVEEYNKKILNDVLDNFERTSVDKVRMSTIPSMLYSISSALLVAIIFFVANIILEIELARLIVIVYIFVKLWPIFDKIQNQIQLIAFSVSAFESVNRLRENLYTNDNDINKDTFDFEFNEEIKFKNISFSYMGSNEKVLDNLSFSIKKNAITVIKGKSGMGKSTIVNLLMGLLKPVTGEILVDNISLNNDNIRSFRKLIGFIPQEPIILNKSIKENILRFNPSVSDEEIFVALEKAQANDFVKNLPDKISTMMGNQGIRFSGGEKQRIVLARVLARNPKILILDEATSALDSENEDQILSTLRSLSNHITVIIVSHRESTANKADYVISL
jgi:ABC-type multidrug transport system fused ATPase/permease subunit